MGVRDLDREQRFVVGVGVSDPGVVSDGDVCVVCRYGDVWISKS